MKTGFQQLVAVSLFLSSLSGLVLANPGDPHSTVSHLRVVPGDHEQTVSNFKAVASNTEDAVQDVRDETWRRFNDLNGKVVNAHQEWQRERLGDTTADWQEYGQSSQRQHDLWRDAIARYDHLAEFQEEFNNNRKKDHARLASKHAAFNNQIPKYSDMTPLQYVNIKKGKVNFKDLEKLDSQTRRFTTS